MNDGDRSVGHDVRSPLGRLVVPRVAPRSAVIIALLLLSTHADAASIFARFEYHSFWSDVLPIIVMIVVATLATWQLRKKIRQQVASAPPEARRSPQEQRLHLLSVLLTAAPMMYPFLLEIDLLFPVLAILATQAAVLIGLRALAVPFSWRLACILPAGLLSLFAGAVAASWPDRTLSPAADHGCALAGCTVSLALGWLLSYLSFPAAYRARA
jgi:hypothetical protein